MEPQNKYASKNSYRYSYRYRYKAPLPKAFRLKLDDKIND